MSRCVLALLQHFKLDPPRRLWTFFRLVHLVSLFVFLFILYLISLFYLARMALRRSARLSRPASIVESDIMDFETLPGTVPPSTQGDVSEEEVSSVSSE